MPRATEELHHNATARLPPTTAASVATTKEPSGVDPTYPPGEIEPLISISIFLIFILLGK